MSDIPSLLNAVEENQDQHASSPNTDTDDSFQQVTPASSRQRRKRTSPRDHATLETAYQVNSKPDKQERLSLVQRTDLNEKEVQIWFQNRRQNDRRKSKPLQPHELIPHFRNGIPVEATKQLPSPVASQERAEAERVDGQSPTRSESPQSSNDLTHSPRQPDQSKTSAASSQQNQSASRTFSTPPSSSEREEKQKDAGEPSQSNMPPPSSDTQLTRKRSHEQMTETAPAASVEEDSPKEAKTLRKMSSLIRLAMTADGAVKVRVNDETTPSPPKQRPQPPTNTPSRRSSGLQRAQSDVSSVFSFKDTVGKGALGRSRDARTWEFYCDKSSRSSLAARAEEEATGSAVGALGLMRSASQKRLSALSPNPTKQNNLRRIQSVPKVKPSLARTKSSMARMQSYNVVYEDERAQSKQGHQRQSSGSDSDKENWLPGTRDSVNEQRRTQPTSQRGTIMQRHQHAQHGHPSLVSPDVDTSVNLSKATSGKAKVDDLDCVQGLLSLSQDYLWPPQFSVADNVPSSFSAPSEMWRPARQNDYVYKSHHSHSARIPVQACAFFNAWRKPRRYEYELHRKLIPAKTKKPHLNRVFGKSDPVAGQCDRPCHCAAAPRGPEPEMSENSLNGSVYRPGRSSPQQRPATADATLIDLEPDVTPGTAHPHFARYPPEPPRRKRLASRQKYSPFVYVHVDPDMQSDSDSDGLEPYREVLDDCYYDTGYDHGYTRVYEDDPRFESARMKQHVPPSRYYTPMTSSPASAPALRHHMSVKPYHTPTPEHYMPAVRNEGKAVKYHKPPPGEYTPQPLPAMPPKCWDPTLGQLIRHNPGYGVRCCSGRDGSCFRCDRVCPSGDRLEPVSHSARSPRRPELVLDEGRVHYGRMRN